MAPDWFIPLAKQCLFRLEYGQPYQDAADHLWDEILKRTRLCQCATSGVESTEPYAGSESTIGVAPSQR